MINSKFTFEKKRIINRWLKKKKTTLLSPEPGPMSARGLQHRTGYERDEPRFELIFRKSKTRSSTRSVVRVPGYPRLAIVSVSIRSTKSREEGGGGRSRKQLERRWRLHETAEALEEIPSSGGGIESIGKEERPSTNNRGSPSSPRRSSPRIEIRFSAEEDLPPKSWNRSPYDGLFSRGRFKMLQ